MTSATCIYCKQTKTSDLFNSEHVLPQSFGTFPGNNMVLHDAVCAECNTYFSRALELRLARGSMEGLERFRVGIARPKQGRRLAGCAIEVRQSGGLHDGAILEWHLGPGETEVKVRPVPQLGFSNTRAGPYEWHRTTDLPSREFLRSRGFEVISTFIQSGGLSTEEATRHI